MNHVILLEKYKEFANDLLIKDILELPIREYPIGRTETIYPDGSMPIEYYPEGILEIRHDSSLPMIHHGTFSNCHYSFQESFDVNRIFYGKKIEDIDIEDLIKSNSLPFLEYEAMLYFWPVILLVIYKYPDSIASKNMFSYFFRYWDNNKEENDTIDDFVSKLKANELFLTKKILLYCLNEIEKNTLKEYTPDKLHPSILKKSLSLVDEIIANKTTNGAASL